MTTSRKKWSVKDRQVFGYDDRPIGAIMNAAVEQTLREFPDTFEDRADARQLLARISLPASERWAYVVTGKAATTTTLALLFEAEFDQPFTVRARIRGGLNPHEAVHALMWHDVFATALQLPRSLGELAGAPDLERIVTVRHPETRAASAFEYLCRSYERRSSDFHADRLRVAALCGLDFETMSGTAGGFVRFLEYVAADLATNPRSAVNAHWRPQTLLIYPQAFRPTLVGRFDAFGTFRRELFARLDRPLPATETRLNERREPDEARARLFRDPAARRLIRDIYEKDFEHFGYEPGRG
jgi:hypothetical protein